MRTQIFVSYSRSDSAWKVALAEQLGAYSGLGLLTYWTDDQIDPGADWLADLYEALDSSSAAVLLVSAPFLSSKFIREHEVPRILANREKGMLVIPVLVRPCPWEAVSWLAKMQMLPGGGDSISSGSAYDIDAKLASTAEAIVARLGSIAETQSGPVAPDETSQSNLRLPSEEPRTARYVCYVARERVSSYFDQVDEETLQASMLASRFAGIGLGDHPPERDDRRTLGQLNVVLRFLDRTETIADLNRTIAQKGRLDADWYQISTALQVIDWVDDDPSLRLEGRVGDYAIRLNCAKRNFSGLNPEDGRYIPTSTNYFLFSGETALPMHGLIRLAAYDQRQHLIMGSPLYLVLDRLSEDLVDANDV